MRKKISVYSMKRDNWNDEWELRVSPSQKVMADDIRARFKEWGVLPPEGLEDIQGLVHSCISISGPFAYMFLHEGRLGAGIVSHECLHVAMAHERHVLRFGMQYEKEDCTNIDNEERLAYYLTSCVAGTFDILYKYKHIKELP